jgi:polysaccharide biosynthesis protein PslJ
VGVDSAMDARRIAGPSIHAIAFSVVLGMILPIAIHYARAARTWPTRIAYTVAAAAVATTMFLTGSRTAFVAFTVLLAVLWLTIPQIRKWTIPGLVVLAVVLHMAFPGAIGMLTERLSPAYLASTESGNQAGRVADYARIVTFFHYRPLLGMGFGTFDPFRFFWVDNQYLILLVELGALGLGAFIAFFASGFGLLYRAGRRFGGELGDLAVALSASVAVFGVTSFTYDSFGFPQPFNLFFILLALGVSLVSGLKEGSIRDQVAEDGLSRIGGQHWLTPRPLADKERA